MIEDRDKIPYPIDNGLIQEAQMIGDGKYVHCANTAIGNYRYYVRRWGETWEPAIWYEAVKAERVIRGIVAESKMGKNFYAPWATRREPKV